MKNIFKPVLLVAIFSTTLMGCFGSSPIEQVKNGVLDLDKSTTVGQAIAGWVDCDKAIEPEWSSFETANGATVVEAICSNPYNSEQPFVQAMEKTMKNRSDAANYFIDSITNKFQFTVNLDDTFEASYIGINVIWSDGVNYEHSFPISDVLEMVYQNSPGIFDLEILNKAVLEGKTEEWEFESVLQKIEIY